MTKLLLVDDHELIRTGIKLMLQEMPGIEIVGETSSGEEAIHLVRGLKPDIILMDIDMPGIGGMETTIRLLKNNRKVKILIVSSHEGDHLPSRLMSLGATGYLTKNANREELNQALQSVSKGTHYIDPNILNQVVLPRLNFSRTSVFSTLSERELQIILMTVRGIEIKEIAQKLFLSVKTINGYHNSALKKLGVKTDVEATRIAIKYGLIDGHSQLH